LNGVRGLIIKRKILGYFFLAPALLFLSVFNFYPIVNSIIMSFTNWTGFTHTFKWIGADNYAYVIEKMPEYWKAMQVNIRFAVYSTGIQTILGFFLAVLIINLGRRWQDFYKVTIYLPVILPAAVVALMWRMFLTPDYGLVNQLLRGVGLPNWAQAWTGDPKYAMGSLIAANVWRYVGFTTVLYYVAMLDIGKEMIESSMVDGCSYLQRIRYFYLPLTRGATEVNVVLSLTGGLRVFDMAYMMTHGGPGTATKTVGMYIIEVGFRNYRFGRALAMSIILFAIVTVAMLITRVVLMPREEY
jgi:raffinose/stachyose/melibiose transport system permease protein